jgi:hypothetical protein
MKTLTAFCGVLGITLGLQAAMDPAAVNHPGSYECETSPSGRLIALSGIGLGEVSPSWRMRLRVVVVELGVQGDRLEHIWPWMQGDWVVIWAPRDVLLIYGHPENEGAGAYELNAYEFTRDGKANVREACEAEKNLARAAFKKKYGRDPKA